MIAKITNVHGQGRIILGNATGETLLDLGPAGEDGFLQVRVFVDPQYPDHITVAVADHTYGELKLPRLRLVVEGSVMADVPLGPDSV